MNKNKVINKSFKKITLGLFIFVFICSFLCVNIKMSDSVMDKKCIITLIDTYKRNMGL